MQNLTVTLIQKDLSWESPIRNKAELELIILNADKSADLIILPEMFTTGFCMKPTQFAEAMNGPTIHWLQQMANQSKTTITGSLVIEENNKYYNRLVWVTPDGLIEKYDKRHLFSYGQEDKHYTAGESLLETHLKGWKIRPLICYDLRFPVWSRNTTDYDLLIYVANWPEARIHHWRSLLIARAIENQSFVIGLNRVGKDGNGIKHNGNSMIISPKGEVILALLNGEEVANLMLSKNLITDYRAKFPALKDRAKKIS